MFWFSRFSPLKIPKENFVASWYWWSRGVIAKQMNQPDFKEKMQRTNWISVSSSYAWILPSLYCPEHKMWQFTQGWIKFFIGHTKNERKICHGILLSLFFYFISIGSSRRNYFSMLCLYVLLLQNYIYNLDLHFMSAWTSQ